MSKALIVHGTKGSPNGNWFPWLAAELGQAGFQTFVPQFPTPSGQNLENWLKTYIEQVGELDDGALLIGHSVGAVFALRLLERLLKPIRAAVLVSGFTGALGLPEYDALNSTFVAGPFDWARIRSNASKIICISGDNDPYVPFEQGKEIADRLGTDHQVIKDGGHLNAEFGFTKFPRLIEELRKIGTVQEFKR